MAVDTYKGYPFICLEDSYEPKPAENLRAGMFCKKDSATGLLVKAVGAADEYAMVCMTNQTDNWIENSGKLQVVKENVTLWTSYFKVGAGYTHHCKLQVSTAPGEEGILTIHAGGAAPVIGRYLTIESVKGTNMLLFDLVRS